MRMQRNAHVEVRVFVVISVGDMPCLPYAGVATVVVLGRRADDEWVAVFNTVPTCWQ